MNNKNLKNLLTSSLIFTAAMANKVAHAQQGSTVATNNTNNATLTTNHSGTSLDGGDLGIIFGVGGGLALLIFCCFLRKEHAKCCDCLTFSRKQSARTIDLERADNPQRLEAELANSNMPERPQTVNPVSNNENVQADTNFSDVANPSASGPNTPEDSLRTTQRSEAARDLTQDNENVHQHSLLSERVAIDKALKITEQNTIEQLSAVREASQQPRRYDFFSGHRRLRAASEPPAAHVTINTTP